MFAIETLKEDFAQTLAFIDKCDNHIFQIKNWALLTSSAVVAFSISQDQDVIALANLALLFAFIYLELIYKSFQDTAIDHNADISIRIDRYLADPAAVDLLVGYRHSFGRKLKYPSVPRVVSIWNSPDLPDTEFRCDDDLGGFRWEGEHLLGSSSLRRLS